MQRADLFPTAPRFYKKRRGVLGHVIDAGNGCGGAEPGRNIWARLRCRRGHEWEVFSGHTVTELKRGIPCPTCNEEKSE